MQNMVYIKCHNEKNTEAKNFRCWNKFSEKSEKIFQKAFDKVKKCAILNFCRASVTIVSKNDDLKKKVWKKIELRLTKLKSMLY